MGNRATWIMHANKPRARVSLLSALIYAILSSVCASINLVYQQQFTFSFTTGPIVPSEKVVL